MKKCNGLGVIPFHKKVGMFRQIQESIYMYRQCKNITPVIIIDEAQFLKNQVLDDLRIIFNFEMDSKDYAILILSGQIPFISQLSRQPHVIVNEKPAKKGKKIHHPKGNKFIVCLAVPSAPSSYNFLP